MRSQDPGKRHIFIFLGVSLKLASLLILMKIAELNAQILILTNSPTMDAPDGSHYVLCQIPLENLAARIRICQALLPVAINIKGGI